MKFTVPLAETGQVSKIITDYINHDNNLKKFIVDFPSIKNVTTFIEQKKGNFITQQRKSLVNQLTEQYSHCGITPPKSLYLLEKENTFTVTTGHQLNLFGGPQFFIHKIVSTIKMCSILKKEYPEYNFLPVFWMATEDHDYDEINQLNIFGKTISSDKTATGPLGRISCASFDNTLNELKVILGESTEATSLIETFNSAMQQKNWAEATRYWVHYFFREYQIIIIDGDDKALKKQFISLAKTEIISSPYKEIEKTSKQLENLGYKTQITPREINLFYIEDNLRERLIKKDGIYKVLNTNIQFTLEELESKLIKSPENFSPNVALRPIYQETILPNIAYIGGPGETAYWLQLKNYFNSFGTPYPMIVLRDFFMWLSQKDNDILNANDVKFLAIFKDKEELRKTLALKFTSLELDFTEEELLIENLKNELLQKVHEIDQSLDGMVKAEMKNVIKLIDKLEKKLIKAIKQKEEININRILKIQQKLLPNGVINERTESFIPYYLKEKENYLTQLIQASNFTDSTLKVI